MVNSRRAINVKNRLKREYDRVKTSNNWMKYKKQRLNYVTKALIIIFRVNVQHQREEITKNFDIY